MKFWLLIGLEFLNIHLLFTVLQLSLASDWPEIPQYVLLLKLLHISLKDCSYYDFRASRRESSLRISTYQLEITFTSLA